MAATNETAYRAVEQAMWSHVGLTPTEHFIDFPGVSGKVRVQDVGQGTPTLFIHGGPNSGSTWAPMLPHLPGIRALLVDRPGTGLSDVADVTSLEDLEALGDRFVAAVLDGLGLDRVDIVASSLGGYMALRSAAQDPDRVGRMVQMACPAGAPGMLTPPFMRMMSVGPIRWLIGRLPASQKANDSILRQIGHGKTLDRGGFGETFNDWYAALGDHTDTMHNESELIGMGATLRGFMPEFTLGKTLPQVTTPTLYLWGEDDGFGGRDVAEATVALQPNAELRMVPDSGHLPWLDFPEAIARDTMAFLAAEATH